MAVTGRVVRAAAAVSAGVLPMALGTGAAEAESYEQRTGIEHTFTAPGDRRVTCLVSATSSLFRSPGSPTFEATAELGTFNVFEPPGTCEAFLTIFVTYSDEEGTLVEGGADGRGTSVRWHNSNDVAGHVNISNGVGFVNCTADCILEFSLNPK